MGGDHGECDERPRGSPEGRGIGRSGQGPCSPLRGLRRAPTGAQVVGLDWRTSISAARKRLRPDVALQGNLDPALVLAGADVAVAGAQAVLADNGGQPGHIFNLGHGVHPASDPGVLAAVVEYVHDATTSQ